jgi:hypothetical protein
MARRDIAEVCDAGLTSTIAVNGFGPPREIRSKTAAMQLSLEARILMKAFICLLALALMTLMWK